MQQPFLQLLLDHLGIQLRPDGELRHRLRGTAEAGGGSQRRHEPTPRYPAFPAASSAALLAVMPRQEVPARPKVTGHLTFEVTSWQVIQRFRCQQKYPVEQFLVDKGGLARAGIMQRCEQFLQGFQEVIENQSTQTCKTASGRT